MDWCASSDSMPRPNPLADGSASGGRTPRPFPLGREEGVEACPLSLTWRWPPRCPLSLTWQWPPVGCNARQFFSLLLWYYQLEGLFFLLLFFWSWVSSHRSCGRWHWLRMCCRFRHFHWWHVVPCWLVPDVAVIAGLGCLLPLLQRHALQCDGEKFLQRSRNFVDPPVVRVFKQWIPSSSLAFLGCKTVDSFAATPLGPVVVRLAQRTVPLGAFSKRPPVCLLWCYGRASGGLTPSTSGFLPFPGLPPSSFSVLVLFCDEKGVPLRLSANLRTMTRERIICSE
jgi:hypothetical protein